MRVQFIISSLLVFSILGLSGCQAELETQPMGIETQSAQFEQPLQRGTTSVPAGPAPTVQNNNPGSIPNEEPSLDPAAIEAAWQSSPHADSYVLDANGENNTCARCHAPINWLPAMEDLPESCFACKFELEPPPPTIAESEWIDVPCNVCHKVDKKDNILPEVAWLEIAPLGEYASVASHSELCLMCHTTGEIPGHAEIQVAGDHHGYVCTDCHSAHDTGASCDAPGCHPDVVDPEAPIPGHDADHKSVGCVACHDGSAMEVGPGEENGNWTTFVSRQTETGAERFAFTSHNVVLQASCERCHFAGNPWELSETVIGP